MRQGRIREEAKSYYHRISGVVDRQFVLKEEEKEHYVALMRKLEVFHGMRVVTYSIMSNQWQGQGQGQQWQGPQWQGQVNY